MRHKGAKANPGRDKILCLCIAARMDINEIRRALEISNCAILYARNTPQYPLTHTLTAMNMTPPKLSNTLRRFWYCTAFLFLHFMRNETYPSIPSTADPYR